MLFRVFPSPGSLDHCTHLYDAIHSPMCLRAQEFKEKRAAKMERNALRHSSLFKALPSLSFPLFFLKAAFPTVTSAGRRFLIIHVNLRDISHLWQLVAV